LTRLLDLQRLQAQVCGLKPESKQSLLLTANLVTSILALIAIVLRLGSRYLVSKRIWVDDIVISVAGLFIFPFSGLAIWSESVIPVQDASILTTWQWFSTAWAPILGTTLRAL
jgi:hypothetical protein